MLDKLEAIHSRFLDVEEKLSDPSIVSDIKEYTKLNKEYKDLKVMDDQYHRYKNLLGNIETDWDV